MWNRESTSFVVSPIAQIAGPSGGGDSAAYARGATLLFHRFLELFSIRLEAGLPPKIGDPRLERLETKPPTEDMK